MTAPARPDDGAPASFLSSTLFGGLAGLVFGLGLLASGMADPSKVLAFLDLAGAWDPSLMLVMGGAIAVALLPFRLARGRSAGWQGVPLDMPTATAIDWRLIGGGVLFGIGWGLVGFCPGPALVALTAGVDGTWMFVLAMVAGMRLHDLLDGMFNDGWRAPERS
jgi:uncharacterized protein